MRLIGFVLIVTPVFAQAQSWEKLIAPGVVYRMEVDNSVPRVIHALRFAREAATLTSQPVFAQGSVFGREDDRKGRATLSETIKSESALAGVNGDFFPWTGDPLGAMVRNGELVSKPFLGRSVFAWGPGYSTVSRLNWKSSATFTGQENLKIDGLNEVCSKDMVVLNTFAAGYAVTDPNATSAVIELGNSIGPTGSWKGQVITVVKGETRIPVGKTQAVLTASGKSAAKLEFLAKGEAVTIQMSTSGLDWVRAKNVVGGGPVVVTAGKPLQAWDAENFNAEFATKRHPRSAIGATALGDIWLVIIEGRQTLSVGATIEELSRIMVRLGCTEAINLDGGGSSEIALTGMIVNRPSDGAERPIANSILVYGTEPLAPPDTEFVIQGRPKLAVGAATDYKVVDDKGRIVPTSSVVWSSQGDAWIDQGGRLRPIQPGKARLKAWVKGKVLTLDVVVEPASVPNGDG